MTAMKNTESGFTLIELMIAIAMTSIVIIVIYSAYNVQTKIYTEQDKAAEMQQNIRAGMFYLQREARMAGYNPLNQKDVSCRAPGAATPAVAPGIHTATKTTFGFSMDLNEDGDCADTGENVTYAVYTADGMRKLGRKVRKDDGTLSDPDPVAENITDVDFVYIFSPPAMGVSAPAPTSSPSSTELDDITIIQVSLLAVSARDRKPARTVSYTVPAPDAWGKPTAAGTVLATFTDSISRRLLTTTIYCRNMGLK